MRRARLALLLRSGLTVAAMLGLYFIIPVPGDNGQDLWLTVILGFAGLTVLTYTFLTLGQRARESMGGDAIRLEALGAVLYGFICFISLVYLALSSYHGQFTGLHNRMDALYFTMSTVATVGFGDVHATGTMSRAVVTAQIAADLIIVGLVARILLPSALSNRQRQRQRDPDDSSGVAGPSAQDRPES